MCLHWESWYFWVWRGILQVVFLCRGTSLPVPGTGTMKGRLFHINHFTIISASGPNLPALLYSMSTFVPLNPRPLHDIRAWGEEILLLKADIWFSQCLWLVSQQFLIAGKSKSKGWSMFRASLCELSVSNAHILFKFQKIFHREGVKSTFLTLQISFAKFKDSSPKQNCHSN